MFFWHNDSSIKTSCCDCGCQPFSSHCQCLCISPSSSCLPPSLEAHFLRALPKLQLFGRVMNGSAAIKINFLGASLSLVRYCTHAHTHTPSLGVEGPPRKNWRLRRERKPIAYCAHETDGCNRSRLLPSFPSPFIPVV